MSKKIEVGVLGATGSVGQQFLRLLKDHPFFTVQEIAASERSAGKRYRDVVNRISESDLPDGVADMIIQDAEGACNSQVLFSGLDSSVAGEVEAQHAAAGHIIISNSKNHRWDQFVPLLIPEVNHDHLALIRQQPYGKGCIVTNPNCSTIGVVMALKPLYDAFGINALSITTLQAISGAGYPGLSASDIMDNVIPHIDGEEEKLESEPRKILGTVSELGIIPSDLKISAQVHRVPVSDGHTAAVQVAFTDTPTPDEILEKWQQFTSRPQVLHLPSAPLRPITYFTGAAHPQPLLHRLTENGMGICTGRLRECPIFGYKFTVLSHNTIRGAAGGAILCAELMKEDGWI